MNLRRMWALLSVWVLLMTGAVVQGQSATREVALYTERMDATGRHGEVLFVASDGTLSSVPVPAGFYPLGYPDSLTLGDVVLSPDGTKLAGTFYPLTGGNVLPVMIADLTLGSCCVVLASPLPQVYAYDLAGFSPDGTQIAFSYVGEGATGTIPYTGGMAIADVASGAVAQMADMPSAMAVRGEEGLAIWALMGEWTNIGIQWSPNCYACEGAFEGEYSLWLPQKSSFLPHSGVYFSPFADTLAGTGETLYAGQSPAYPVSPDPAMLPIPNVIQYLPDGVLPTFGALGTAHVVYFDPATLDLGDGAHWVSNGVSFLVTPPNTPTWTLKDRIGGAQPIPAPVGARFLTGTSGGWLAMSAGPAGTDLVRYVASPAGAFGAVIDQTADASAFSQGYIVLDKPDLGAGVTATPPPVVLPPVAIPPTPTPIITAPATPFVVQCSGFLPSRLIPGQPARVTPGDPNNLRALPDVNAPLVGVMPGGAEFMVMTGPVCDSAGMAWWQVTYNGLIGWTVEGQGTTYFTEPILPAG
ncbi:MAG: SH3 domain-containing protein [Anaerolineae bacterium]